MRKGEARLGHDDVNALPRGQALARQRVVGLQRAHVVSAPRDVVRAVALRLKHLALAELLLGYKQLGIQVCQVRGVLGPAEGGEG